MIPATSRRALIGTSAAMLLAGAFEAGATKADELDRDLIDASREYVALEAEIIRIGELEGEVPVPERAAVLAQADPLYDRQEEIREAMAATPARTLAGLKAKAAALQAWLPSSSAGTAPYRDEDALAWSLCNDLLGRP